MPGLVKEGSVKVLLLRQGSAGSNWGERFASKIQMSVPRRRT